MNSNRFPSRGANRASPRRERGVSLIIAMLMLVVIGFASVAIMRNATSTDQAVTNNRIQTQANQYAQLALQFCENQLKLNGRIVVVQAPATPAAWTVKNNWIGAGTIPAYRLVAADIVGTEIPRVFPQCMIERTALSTKVYIVTARGFSPDYAADTTTGATIAGSVVWLQSTVWAT